ncbi:MAG: tetratricopeptide repeat protein [Pirellulaceae bacterium]
MSWNETRLVVPQGEGFAQAAARWLAWCAVGLACLTVGTATTWAQAESSPEAAARFADVANFQNEGAFELAAEEWAAFLKKYPTDPLAAKAQNYLAVCQLQLERYSDAISNFETVIKKHPQADFREEAMLNLASANYAYAQAGEKNRYPAAATAFAELLKAFPKSKFAEQALFFQGESLYLGGKQAEAIPVYNQLVENYPKSDLAADALYAIGVTHEELKQTAQASGAFDRFLKQFSQHPLVPEVKMRKAEALLLSEKYDEADNLFREVTATPDFPLADHAWYRLGFVQLKADKLAEAAQSYAHLAENFPQSVYAAESTMLAGRCFYRAGKLDEAVRWLTAAGKLEGEHALEAGHWLARVYLRQGKPAEARQLATSLLPQAGKSKFNVQLKMDAADAVYELPGERENSIGLYQNIAKEHAEHELAPQALYNAAFAALELGKHPVAAELSGQFEQRYANHELRLDALYVGAEAQLQADQLPQAEQSLRKLIEAGKGREELGRWNLRLALALYLQEKYDQVAAVVAPVVDQLTEPDAKAQGQYLLGASDFQLDKLPEAKKALEASLAASTRWSQADEARLMLARTLHKLGDNAAAIGQIGQMIKDYPNSLILDRAYYRQGEFEFAADNFAGSAGSYRQVVEKFPQSPLVPHALYGEGWALMRQGKPEDAEKRFAKLVSDHPNHSLVPDTLLARAAGLRQLGQYPEAVKTLNQFLGSAQAGPGKRDALYLKGMCLIESKQYSEAIKALSELHRDYPENENGDKVLYELAWAYRASDNEEQARAQFGELAKSHAKSPLAAEANYHLGEAAYDARDYDKAQAFYTAAKSGADNAEVGEKAAYKLAWSKYQQGDYQAALGGFGEQMMKYPEGPLLADAIFMQAECLFKEKKHAEALASYQRVPADRLSSDDMRALLLLHAGQSASQQKLWGESRKWFGKLVEQLPESSLVPEAKYELGWASYNEGKIDEAITHFNQAADSSRGQAGARSRFMLGEVEFERKNYDDAVKHFQRVVFGFGGEDAIASVKNWQAKSAYELGRCHEVQIRAATGAKRAEILANATKYYTLVTEKFPQAGEAKLAQSRLEVLAKL